MIADKNDIFKSASETLYELNTDELVREQCQAREDYEKHERTQKKKLADQAAIIQEQEARIKQLEAQLAKLNK